MPSRLNTFFDSRLELRRLSEKAQQLHRLQQYFENIPPPSLRPLCHVIGLERGTLTLAAENGAVAAKLRQLANDLTSRLQEGGWQVTGIRVRVQVVVSRGKPVYRPRILSSSASRHLANLADTLSDSPLKRALEKFSKRRTPPG